MGACTPRSGTHPRYGSGDPLENRKPARKRTLTRVFPAPSSFSTAQQDDRKRHQAQREQYAQQGQHDAQRVRTKDADERLRGACAPGGGTFGADAGAALLLVIVQRTLGVREVRVVGHPDSTGRDTPETYRGFVVRDPLRVEHRAHVAGLVIGHVAQVQKQLGYDAMLMTYPLSIRSLICIFHFFHAAEGLIHMRPSNARIIWT